MGGNNLPQKQARTHQVGTTPSLPPSSYHFPTGLPSANSKPLIVTEEVQPFHMNPEKVALKEPGEQRRRKESTRNTSETAPLCELGPPPAVTPPQPHPSRGVPGEAGSPAQTECRREGGPGERGRGQGRGAELQAAGFVQSGPGCQLGSLGGRSEAVDPKPARVRSEDPRGARADDPGPRPRSRVGRVPVPADSHPKHPEPRVRPAAGSPATHRHSSSTLSSCRLLDCTPWARAAASFPAAAPPPAAPARRGPAARQRGLRETAGAQGQPGAGREPERGMLRGGSGGGSGADARHSAGEAQGGGAGRWALPLRCCRGRSAAAGRRSGRLAEDAGGWGGSSVPTLVSHALQRCERTGLGPALGARDLQSSGSPSELRALVAPGPSLRTRSLLKRIPGCLDPSAGSHAAPLPHRRDAPAPARHLPLRGPRGEPAGTLPRDSEDADPRLCDGWRFTRFPIRLYSFPPQLLITTLDD